MIDIAEIKIDGIDVENGIKMTSGKVRTYLQILKTFHINGRKKLEDLATCIKERNIESYRIHVHSIKSSSGNIGAHEISKLAESLEMAAENEDTDFIEAYHHVFIKKLETVLDKIHPFTVEDSNKQIMDIEELKPELKLLKTAMLDYNIVAVNEHGKNIQKYLLCEGVGDVVNEILQNKMIGNYEDAILLIDSIV